MPAEHHQRISKRGVMVSDARAQLHGLSGKFDGFLVSPRKIERTAKIVETRRGQWILRACLLVGPNHFVEATRFLSLQERKS